MRVQLERMQAKFSQLTALRDNARHSDLRNYNAELETLAVNMQALQACIEAHEVDTLRNSLRSAIEAKQGHSIYLVR